MSSSPSRMAPRSGGAEKHVHAAVGGLLRQACRDRRHQQWVPCGQHPTAEDDVCRHGVEPKSPKGDGGEGDTRAPDVPRWHGRPGHRRPRPGTATARARASGRGRCGPGARSPPPPSRSAARSTVATASDRAVAGRGRPRRGRRTTAPPREPMPPPQSPEIWPSAGNRAVRPSGSMPTQLMPAPQTTATPRGASMPARRSAKVSLSTSTLRAQPRACTPPPAAPPRREVGVGQARRDHGRPTSRPRRRRRRGRTACARSASTAALDADHRRRGTRRRGPGPSTGRRRDQRDVGLAVARVEAQQDSGCWSPTVRPTRGAPGCARSAGRSGRSARSILADQRVGEQGVEDPVAAAAQGGVERQVLVRRHVARSGPAYSGLHRRDRQRARRPWRRPSPAPR